MKTIKIINTREKYVYAVYKTPFPFDNRDIVNYHKFYQEPKTNIVFIKEISKPKYLPVKPGLVRIPKSKGFWKLTPLKGGYVKVIQQGVGEPGGNAPNWVINLFIVDGPLATLARLKKMIKKEKYKNAKFKFLKEGTKR